MKKSYTAALLLMAALAAPLASACEIKVDGLPKEEVAKLEAVCKEAQAKVLADAALAVEASKKPETKKPEPKPEPKPDPKKETAIASLPTPEDLTPYGKVALEVAGAIGVAAKELGMAINDFLWTPAGILTIAIVMGKLFGMQFLGLLFCGLVLMFANAIIRRVLICSYEERPVVFLWGFMTRTKKIPVFCAWKDLNESQGATIAITAIATCVLVWAFLANMVV